MEVTLRWRADMLCGRGWIELGRSGRAPPEGGTLLSLDCAPPRRGPGILGKPRADRIALVRSQTMLTRLLERRFDLLGRCGERHE